MGINNQVQLVGNIGQAPVTREGKDSPFVTFSICTKEKSRGEMQDVWHNCIAFRSTAEYVSKYIQKGDLVIANGAVSYNTKSDVKYTSFVMYSVMKLKSAGGGNGGSGGAQEERPRESFREFEQRQQEKPRPQPSGWDGVPPEVTASDVTTDDVPF